MSGKRLFIFGVSGADQSQNLLHEMSQNDLRRRVTILEGQGLRADAAAIRAEVAQRDDLYLAGALHYHPDEVMEYVAAGNLFKPTKSSKRWL